MHVLAQDEDGTRFEGFIPQDDSTMADPLLLNSEMAQQHVDSLIGTSLGFVGQKHLEETPGLYPSSTTLRILAVAADELKILPWDAQEHLNALYQGSSFEH